jgi:outer membrane protein OmpA-like peptidoglycan-associated protein
MKWSNLTALSKTVIALLVAGIIGGGVYFLAPGLRTAASQKLDKLDVSDKEINNMNTSAELPTPSADISSDMQSKPLIRIGGYAWNAQSAIIVANGGPKTTKGSLMEKSGINLEIVRQDWLTELRNLQMKFIDLYDKGENFPKEGVSTIMIMGDGAPYYISSTQQAIDEKYGKGKYNLEIVGALGLSYGEDKLIGPPSWKMNPQSMKGALISTVIGDGDWVVAVNYAFANGLKVNPDPATYDADAVNFVAAANDDYIEGAKALIKAQKENFTIPLAEVKDGKKTGNTVNRKIDGCATWTPGDKMVFDALTGYTDIVSTKEFNNQMPVAFITVKQWAEKNKEQVVAILKSSYIAGDQMKQYDSWRKRASEAVTKLFAQETPQYWYDMFQGTKGEKSGISYNMGGSRVFNFADANQYFGITDGSSRYKAVYDQVSKYLVKLDPAGFNENVKRVVPYDEAVDLSFLKQITDISKGDAYTADYSKKASSVMASGEWHINFESGRAVVRPEGKDVLEQIYNLLVQAEDAKLELTGYTDNTGNKDGNYSLSSARAEAVKSYLMQKGIPATRFQKIDGKGQDNPVADNSTDAGKAQNRRVVVTLLK